MALGGIVKIKTRRKRSRRGNGASPRKGGEQSLGRAGWSGRPGWRRPRASQTQISSPRVHRACLFQGDCKPDAAGSAPSLPAFPRGGRGAYLPIALRAGETSSPKDAPAPCGPVARPGLGNSALGRRTHLSPRVGRGAAPGTWRRKRAENRI